MANDMRVRLPILGGETEVTLPVPGGRGAVTAALPAARKLSLAMMNASVAVEAEAGRKVSCKSGCSACCRQLIPVSLAEAKSLSVALSRLPPAQAKAVRHRFERALEKLEAEGLIGPPSEHGRTALIASNDGDATERWINVNDRYFGLGIACPFLEKDRCSVYEDRPFVCREYLVTSPASLCASLSRGVRPVPRPAYATPTFSRMAETLDGVRPGSVPLPLALEWLAVVGDKMSTDHDSRAVLEMFVEDLEWTGEGG